MTSRKQKITEKKEQTYPRDKVSFIILHRNLAKSDRFQASDDAFMIEGNTREDVAQNLALFGTAEASRFRQFGCIQFERYTIVVKLRFQNGRPGCI